MSDLPEFERQLDDAARQTIAQFVEFHKTVAQTVYRMLVTDSRTVGLEYGSPVWTGRYRGSFTIAINQIDARFLPPHPETSKLRWPQEPKKKYPNVAAADVRRRLEGLKPFDVIYIANSVPYVRRIEFGHSKLKAPRGVFEVTVAKAELRLGEQAERIAIVVGK